MAIFRISAYRRCMFFVALIIASAVYPSQALAATTVADSMDETMMNLQKALNNERNAEARYHAYARKAEEEGYATVSGAKERVHPSGAGAQPALRQYGRLHRLRQMRARLPRRLHRDRDREVGAG